MKLRLEDQRSGRWNILGGRGQIAPRCPLSYSTAQSGATIRVVLFRLRPAQGNRGCGSWPLVDRPPLREERVLGRFVEFYSAPGEAWERGMEQPETFHWDPAGNQLPPGKAGQPSGSESYVVVR
jgi:hypothetical protein